MKIAMLGHKKIPSRDGGVEVVVEELATRIVSRGHDVTVFSRKDNVDRSERAAVLGGPPDSYKGVIIQEVATLRMRGLAAVTSSFFATLKAIRIKPDILHFHAMGPALMVGLARAAGLRTVVTIHGLDWQRAKWGKFASWYLRQGERAAVKYADEVIVLSKNLQAYFEAEYGRKTTFIPNGVDRHAPRAVSILGSKYGLVSRSYILFVGRIVPEKGLEYLLAAFKRLNTSMRLVIAGGASDSTSYFDYISDIVRGDDRIVMAGFTQGEELAEMFSNAYLYVLPSDLEGMPISLLEAMSYGNCCVVSDIPESLEVIADSGATFERGSIPSLLATMQLLVDNPDRAERFRKLASIRVERRFDWEDVVTDTLDLYRARGSD